MHPGLSPRLGCFSTKCDKCFQFSVKRGHISRILCNKWRDHIIHPLCLCIYEFDSSLFYSHHDHEGDVIIVPIAMGFQQGDPWGGWGGALFAFAHFKGFKFYS
jgi:hypothetical protein